MLITIMEIKFYLKNCINKNIEDVECMPLSSKTILQIGDNKYIASYFIEEETFRELDKNSVANILIEKYEEKWINEKDLIKLKNTSIENINYTIGVDCVIDGDAIYKIDRIFT